ncbi:MAG: prevent-host-death protein [Bacteroidales bacterium]|jgi:predicted transcriptional regulator|nr:prevent-host-death protein [Bacteroidales bacterium]
MLVISSREFRSNQKKYFDLARNSQILVKRGNDTFVISVANPQTLYRPEIVRRVHESLENLEKGNVQVIKDVHNLWSSLGIE